MRLAAWLRGCLAEAERASKHTGVPAVGYSQVFEANQKTSRGLFCVDVCM